jgi:hypothetical protein
VKELDSAKVWKSLDGQLISVILIDPDRDRERPVRQMTQTATRISREIRL